MIIREIFLPDGEGWRAAGACRDVLLRRAGAEFPPLILHFLQDSSGDVNFFGPTGV